MLYHAPTWKTAPQQDSPCTAGEAILLTTLLPSQDPVAVPQDAVAAAPAHLDRMEAEVNAILQQARATHASLQQLQAREAAGADVSYAIKPSLAQGAWVLVALVMVFVLLQLWRRGPWQRQGTGRMALDDDSLLPVHVTQGKTTPAAAVAAHGTQAGQVPAHRAVAVEPEFADASDSDWGVSHAAELDPQFEFDLEAAANEVARVRQDLAQRREARAMQREEHARRLREMAEQEQRDARDAPAWSDSMPAPEVLDVACDDAVANVSMPSATIPFWSRPSQWGASAASSQSSTLAPAETPAVAGIDIEIDVAAEAEEMTDNADGDETQPSLDKAYVVKLALARESAAVELWEEARELIDEVLESGIPLLQAQARALLVTIAQRQDGDSGGG